MLDENKNHVDASLELVDDNDKVYIIGVHLNLPEELIMNMKFFNSSCK